MPGSPRLHPVSLSLCWLCFVSFTVTYHSHEYNYMLGPGSVPSKLLNPGVVLGTLTHTGRKGHPSHQGPT